MTVHVEHPPTSGLGQETKPTPQHAPPVPSWYSPAGLWQRKTMIIAALAIVGITVHLALRCGVRATAGVYQIPLLATLGIGGAKAGWPSAGESETKSSSVKHVPNASASCGEECPSGNAACAIRAVSIGTDSIAVW